MAVDAPGLVVARSLPIVVVGLHDVASEAGLGLVGKTVGKEIDADVASHGNDPEGEEQAFAAPYEITNAHALLLALSGASRIREDVHP